MDKHFCPYCMSPVGAGEPCKACGLTAGNYIPSPHHLPPGTVLNGRYLVGRVLGEGGFGITYIGCDLRLELKVAIKEYYPVDRSTRNAAVTLDVTSFMGLSAQSFERGKQKFLDEARTMARMDKQQVIVSVRDFFQANNTAYIVMEYIEGTTFSDLVEQKGGRIPPEELFQILEPLFRALSIMHENGLIHRDISPDNLMLENGKVRLLDFGCARETTRGTETLTIALKHGYAPIEQYQQKGQGPWTDIYALCATIYYCLTGKAPPQALDRIVEDGLLLPSKLGVAIAPHQEAALLKGLMIRPNRRYQSVEELRAALYAPAPEHIPISTPEPNIQTQAVTEEPPAPEPPPAEPEEEAVQTDPSEEKPPRKTPSKGLWAAIAGAAAVLLLVLVVFLPRGGGTPEPAPTGTEPIGTEPSPSALVESDLFANAVYLPETTDEAAFRIMMENDSVSAVVLSADSNITISDGPLEITKPLRLEEGASLHLWQSVTVRGEGLLQIEGSVVLEGLLRTVEGGGVAVGPAGELTGSTLVWLEGENDLTVAAGGVANIGGVDYGGEDSEERFLVLDEDYLFAYATHVNSFAELRKAVQNIYTIAIVIDSDINLLDSWACSVPVLISEGVTVTGQVQNYDFAAEDSHCWLQDASILINYGTLVDLNLGDFDGNEGDDFCAILNYGSLNGDLFLDCRGSLLNLGEITVTAAQVLQTNLYNWGTITHSSENEELNWLNFFCDTVYNDGEIVEMGRNNSYLTLNNGVSFRNFGTLRIQDGGGLENQAQLENRGRLIVDAGGRLDNAGWLIADAGGGTLELSPDSTLGHAGLIQWCSSSELVFPHQVDNGGGSVLKLYDRDDTMVVTTEAELRDALADDGCGLVQVAGDITVNGGLTITKGVVLDGNTLSFSRAGASFDVAFSGPDAFLYGGVLELNGYGCLTLTDGAIIANVQTMGCKDLTIQDGAKLVVWSPMELCSGTVVKLDHGGHLINLSGMTLEQADISIGESSVFRSCEMLELRSSSVYVGGHGEFLCNNADVALYNTPLTIDENGFFSTNANHDGYTLKLWSVNNYGWTEIGQPVQLGTSSSTNYGTIQISNDLTLTGALDNKGTILALWGATIQPQGTSGSFIGNPPENRSEWTSRPW